MKTCGKCGVSVRGADRVCPLCGFRLTGEDEAPLYPAIPTLYRRFALLFRLLLLASVAGAAASVAVNLLLPGTVWWSLYVVLGIACFWLSVVFFLRKRHSIPQNISVHMVLVSAAALLWDWWTGWRGWSLTFALPILASAAMVALAVLAQVMKWPAGDYVVCLVAVSVFGVLPAVFCLTGVVTMVIPSVICSALSVVMFAALILFEGKGMWVELGKRFHV